MAQKQVGFKITNGPPELDLIFTLLREGGQAHFSLVGEDGHREGCFRVNLTKMAFNHLCDKDKGISQIEGSGYINNREIGDGTFSAIYDIKSRTGEMIFFPGGQARIV